MYFKISSIVDYTAWLLKKYNALQRMEENNVYRILEIKKSTTNQYKLIIQIVGKSYLMECSPEEIMSMDRSLKGFSKNDIKTISLLACDQIKKPKYKIIMQAFCEEFNKIIFKLQQMGTDTTIIKTADQIVLDKQLINNLSGEDVSSISYVAGYECSQNGNQLKSSQ